MERLIQIFHRLLDYTPLKFKRYLWDNLSWEGRLIGIVGPRGAGKTTFMLQYIKEKLYDMLDSVLYVSLDNLFFSSHSLTDLAEEFVRYGGKYLFLDEVHKYPNWAKEVKNLYDIFPELKIMLTGSSALNLFQGNVDLSRRIVFYKMFGLSFREFIKIKYNISFISYSLEEILSNSRKVASEVNGKIPPLKYFDEYVRQGYFPFFIEEEKFYLTKLQQVVNQILESDLPLIENIDYGSVVKLKRLFSIIAEVVPFKPNISDLAKKIGINRATLLKYLNLLERAYLLLLLRSDSYGMKKMAKPEKIYLANTNFLYALSETIPNKGNIRETFFISQLVVNHMVNYTQNGDFIIDNKYIFEVGGKNKTAKQIAGLDNAFIVSDDIDYPYKNVIPLWLFGFLY